MRWPLNDTRNDDYDNEFQINDNDDKNNYNDDDNTFLNFTVENSNGNYDDDDNFKNKDNT